MFLSAIATNIRNIEIPVRRHQKSRKNTKSQNETVDSLPVEVFLALLSNQSGALKGALPRENMLAQLLVLGLHGKDVRIIDSVQHRTEDEPFGNTLQKILAEAVLPLMTILLNMCRTAECSTHPLVPVPDCQDLLVTVYALLEARTRAYNSVVHRHQAEVGQGGGHSD